MYLPLFVGSVFVFVLLCITLFCNHLEEDERAGCLAFIVLQMSCYCKCSVTLPHGAVCLQCVIVVFPDHTHLLFIFRLEIWCMCSGPHMHQGFTMFFAPVFSSCMYCWVLIIVLSLFISRFVCTRR